MTGTNSTPSAVGGCAADTNGNGICDNEEDCLGVIDECGICDGPGAIYECGCSDIPEGDCDCDGNVLDECGVCGGDGIAEGDCDCDGNQLDALGICGGDCEEDANGNGLCDDNEVMGCTDSAACNYDAMPHSMTDRVLKSMRVACVEVLAPSTSADVKTFLKATATVMEIKMSHRCVWWRLFRGRE